MKGLKAKRIEKNVSQATLAKAVGVKPNTLCQWELGKREPDIATLKKLAEFFGCTVDELL